LLSIKNGSLINAKRFIGNTIKMSVYIICEKKQKNNPVTIRLSIYQETRIQDIATN